MWPFLLVVFFLFLYWFTRNPVVSLQVTLLRRRRADMWVPVDKLEIGESCSVRVEAVKRSGKLVELSLDDVILSDGDAVTIDGGIVTAAGEGEAEVKAELIANLAINGKATLTVVDSVVSLEVLLGREE
jgi:hypothetical protein